jgi:regulator of sirC expression with transglutaminase-like and TPR domain
VTDALSPNRQLFSAIVRRQEERLDLALTSLLICKEEYPRIVIEDYLQRLDNIAADLQIEVDLEGDAYRVLRGLAEFLSGTCGYTGNRDSYYDPRNSYLSEVLDSRTGIPITLSILYLEVARRAGLKMLPVSFPGHFLVKLPTERGDIYLDPFNDGRILDREGCVQLLHDLYGPSIDFTETMLGAATKRQLLTRMLLNLKAIYLRGEDFRRALRTIDLLATVSPWDLEQVRDRGLVHLRLNQVDEARADLVMYAQHGPPGPDRDAVIETIREL